MGVKTPWKGQIFKTSPDELANLIAHIPCGRPELAAGILGGAFPDFVQAVLGNTVISYDLLVDVLCYGASDATIASDTTISGIKRYNVLTINSGITLTVDGQPGVILCNSLVNYGTIKKSLTGGLGGESYSGSARAGRGGGGLIILARSLKNTSLVNADGGTSTAGGSSGWTVVGQPGEGGNINRIGSHTVGSGGAGGNSGGAGNFGGGGGKAGGYAGGAGGIVTYFDNSAASVLLLKVRKAVVDDWLTTFGQKAPTTPNSYPSLTGAGGGGGALNGSTSAGGKGGGGGGEIIIYAGDFDNAGGTIRANAGAGSNAWQSAGGGGGGGGGLVYVCYKKLTAAGTLQANGAAGGTGNAGNGAAGTAGTTAMYSV